MLQSMVDGSAGRLASAELVNGELVITTTATGPDAFIGVGGDANGDPVERGFFLQPVMSIGVSGIDVSASGSTGSEGRLEGIVGDVSLSGGTLSFTAAGVGPDFFSLDEVSATVLAQHQVSALDFSGASDGDFRDTVYTDGLGGEVSVSVAGQTVTAAMANGKAATLANLRDALVIARDGEYSVDSTVALTGQDTGSDLVPGAPTPAQGAVLSIDLTDVAEGSFRTVSLIYTYAASAAGNPEDYSVAVSGLDSVNLSVALRDLGQVLDGRLNVAYNPVTHVATFTTVATGSGVTLAIPPYSLALYQGEDPSSFPSQLLGDTGADVGPAGPDLPPTAATVELALAVAGTDRLAPAPVVIDLDINGVAVTTFFNPGPGATVADLLAVIGNIEGVASATLANGTLTLTTDATGASASLSVVSLDFRTASFSTEPVAAIANALGTVTIDGDTLVLTAKNGGVDPLQLSGFAGTQEDAAESSPHIVDLVFANTSLRTAAPIG